MDSKESASPLAKYFWRARTASGRRLPGHAEASIQADTPLDCWPRLNPLANRHPCSGPQMHRDTPAGPARPIQFSFAVEPVGPPQQTVAHRRWALTRLIAMTLGGLA